MPNKACNGPQGNHTSVKQDDTFVPTFTNFPLTHFKHDKKGNILFEITDEDVERMRNFDIENKK